MTLLWIGGGVEPARVATDLVLPKPSVPQGYKGVVDRDRV